MVNMAEFPSCKFKDLGIFVAAEMTEISPTRSYCDGACNQGIA